MTPPPPPPPPSSPPPPPPPGGDGRSAQERAHDAADAAAAAYARGSEQVAIAVDRLGAQSAQFGLDVHGSTASVWPVLGVAAMTLALIVDRIKEIHTVPVRWLIALLLGGVVVVLGELRRGGKMPALDSLPPWATTVGLRLSFLLLLATQLTSYLSIGVVQVLWCIATLLVAIPVVRGHRAVREFRLGSIAAAPESVGAVLVVAALVVGLLPKQGDVGTTWSVVAGIAAAVVLGVRLLPAPVRDAALDAAALLVVGVAVTEASLTIVGLLWVGAAWLLGSARWRAVTAGRSHPARRSLAFAAVVGCVLAGIALFGTFDSIQGAGYYSGGYTYGYDSYEEDYGYTYDAFAYYNPGFFWASSGRGQDGAPLAAAGVLALAAFAWRGGSSDRRVTYAAAAVAVGTFLWVAFTGSLHYFPVWVAAAGTLVTTLWSARVAWRESTARTAAASAGAP